VEFVEMLPARLPFNCAKWFWFLRKIFLDVCTKSLKT
jgi:hypothetical protein